MENTLSQSGYHKLEEGGVLHVWLQVIEAFGSEQVESHIHERSREEADE